MDLDEMALSHGVTRRDMLIREMDVYGRPADEPADDIRPLGLCAAGKTLTPVIEFAVWKRGAPAVTYVADLSAIDITMEFTIMQFDPTWVADWLDGEVDRTDADNDILQLGTEPNDPPEITLWWIGTLRDGRPLQFCMRRGVNTAPGALTTGSGEHVGMPVTFTGYPEEDICDKTGDLFYICIGKLDVPSGGFIDPCEADLEPCEA